MSDVPDWLEEATNDPDQISLFDPTETLRERSQYTLDQLREMSKQPISRCDCCGGNSKVYAYKLGSYARVLCWLAYVEEHYKVGTYFHIPTSGAINGGGDYAKLRYWNLIEPMPHDPGSKKRSSGMWKLTPFGRDFVHERTTVHGTCYYRHPEGGVLGFEPEQVGIRDVLGRHFSYPDLMAGYTETHTPVKTVKNSVYADPDAIMARALKGTQHAGF